jgi:hypothetical protein
MNCPHCGKEAVIILYGDLDIVGAKKAYGQEFVWAGCEVAKGDEAWFCRNCRSKFGQLSEKNFEYAFDWIEVERKEEEEEKA